MAKDPRKSGAYDSGMRGREKPKSSSANAGAAAYSGQRAPKIDNGPGEAIAGPGKMIGDPDGVNLSAYASGMRGIEKPKQKDASGAANQQPRAGEAGGNRQNPHSTVGKPGGHDDAGKDPGSGVSDGTLQDRASSAYKMGGPGENLESAASGEDPMGEPGIIGEEDDTHINVRIPKASLKKKQSGMAGSI